MSNAHTGNVANSIAQEEHLGQAGAKKVVQLGYDGANFSVPNADTVALKITDAGSILYLAIAAIGSAQASAVWQARKIDQSSGVLVTWAGSGNFNQVATDLTALTYS